MTTRKKTKIQSAETLDNAMVVHAQGTSKPDEIKAADLSRGNNDINNLLADTGIATLFVKTLDDITDKQADSLSACSGEHEL